MFIKKKEMCSSSSLEETCTWDVQEEDVKIKSTQLKGKDKIKEIVYSLKRFWQININDFKEILVCNENSPYFRMHTRNFYNWDF